MRERADRSGARFARPEQERAAERVGARAAGPEDRPAAVPPPGAPGPVGFDDAATQVGAPEPVRRVLGTAGSALDARTRDALAGRLDDGHPSPAFDLGQVRVHTDDVAAGAARSLRARAFTVGTHIGFAAGAYQPGSAGGRALLAHELAHVGQQVRDGRPAIACAPEPVEQLRERGVTFDRENLERQAEASYWVNVVGAVFTVVVTQRMYDNPEERDAVLAAL